MHQYVFSYTSTALMLWAYPEIEMEGGGLYIFVVEKWLPTHFRSKIPTTLSSTPFNISELASLFKNDCKIEISFDRDM